MNRRNVLTERTEYPYLDNEAVKGRKQKDEYKAVFDNEIEQLANEYELNIGKKGYILDNIWEKCEQVHGGHTKDDVKTLTMASGSNRLKEALEDMAGRRSISTWEDLTTRFLAQFFPLGRNAKLQNDILMFQQHQGESLSKAWTRFQDLLQKSPYHGIDLWLQV
ncbi:zinc finger, CCHC-type containing protein [Tanacetum coccineum]